MSKALDKLFGNEQPLVVDTPSSIPTVTLKAPPSATEAIISSSCRDLPIDLLVDMEQPFRLYNEAEMEAMRKSIVAHGVIQRLIVRPWEDGKYQIISGRNRRTGARLAGYVAVPCEVRNLNDDEAQLQMLETNLSQRDSLLPSEKGWAYRLRLETMKRQGERTDLTCAQSAHKLNGSKSRDVLADQVGESKDQIRRYIRLTYLIPTLLEAVDNGGLGFGCGVALSYLSNENQTTVYQYCFEDHPCALSQQLAEQLRQAGEQERLSEDIIQNLFSPAVSKPKPLKSIPFKPLKKLFPKGVTQRMVERTMEAALKAYFEAGNQIIDD